MSDRSSLCSSSSTSALSPMLNICKEERNIFREEKSKIQIMSGNLWKFYVPIEKDTSNLNNLRLEIEECRTKIKLEEEKAKASISSLEEKLKDLTIKQKDLENKLFKLQEANSVSDFVLIDHHYKT